MSVSLISVFHGRLMSQTLHSLFNKVFIHEAEWHCWNYCKKSCQWGLLIVSCQFEYFKQLWDQMITTLLKNCMLVAFRTLNTSSMVYQSYYCLLQVSDCLDSSGYGRIPHTSASCGSHI